MKFSRSFPRFCILGLFGALIAPVCAQDQTDETAPIGVEGAVADADNARLAIAEEKATKKEKEKPKAARALQEARRLQSENRLREVMRRCGMTATTAQDAILAYLAADETARTQVRASARQLANAIRRAAPPERIKDLNSDYKKALERDRLRRETARIALNAQVGYSLDPVVEALLLLAGILGDGQSGVNLGSLFPYQTPAPTPFFGPPRGVEITPFPTFPMPSNRSVSALTLPPTPPRGANYGANVRWDSGVVMSKGEPEEGEIWIEIRADSGRSDRLWPQWKGGASGGFEPEISKSIAQIPLGARVRFSSAGGRERQRLIAIETLETPPQTQDEIAEIPQPAADAPAPQTQENPDEN